MFLLTKFLENYAAKKIIYEHTYTRMKWDEKRKGVVLTER